MGDPLKQLHTSDWHLGKKLFKLERLPEQERFLNELLDIIKREGIHHLLVAGDIFDKARFGLCSAISHEQEKT
jgi:exonuclease SbcD